MWAPARRTEHCLPFLVRQRRTHGVTRRATKGRSHNGHIIHDSANLLLCLARVLHQLPVTERSDLYVVAAVLFTFLLWGTALPLIRSSLASFSPGHIALIRMAAASAMLGIYAAAARRPLPSRRDLPAIAVSAFLGVTVYHLAMNYGLVHVTSGSSSMLINTAPIFTALLAAAFLGDRLPIGGWMGIGLGFCGAGLIVLGEGRDFTFDPHLLLPLLAALAWSANMVMQKPLLRRYTPIDLTCWSVWIGTLVLLFWAPGSLAALRAAPTSAAATVVYLGVAPIGLAYATWAFVLSRMSATRAGSLLYGIPIVVMITAAIWFGERPQPLALAGGGLALCGVYVVSRARPSG